MEGKEGRKGGKKRREERWIDLRLYSQPSEQ
jgi:hypothetical protein